MPPRRKPYYQEDLVDEMTARWKVSAAFAKAAVRVMLDCWRRAILRGDQVHLPNLGVLYATPVAEHTTIVPSTKQRVVIPAYRRVKMRVSEVLRKELRGPSHVEG